MNSIPLVIPSRSCAEEANTIFNELQLLAAVSARD